MLVNIAKDDTKALFVDPSDITALQLTNAGKEVIIYGTQGRLLHAELKSYNLDMADIVQKLEKSGTPLLPFTTRDDNDQEYRHYIAPSAVTYATISKPTDTGMVGAIIGVKGMMGSMQTWKGGLPKSELDTLMSAVQSMKTLFEYKPENAHSRWYEAAALYIDPASVTLMKGHLDDSQIDVYCGNSGSLDVQVAYHNMFDPKTSFQSLALQIYNNKQYTGPLQGIEAVNDIMEQLQKEAYQARVDFVNKIAAANGDLVNISTETQAAFVRKEDIASVSLYEVQNDGKHSFSIAFKEIQPGSKDRLYVNFNTVAERQAAVDAISAPKSNPKRHLKP